MAVGTPESLATINDNVDRTAYTSSTVAAAEFETDDLIVAFVNAERTTSNVETPTMSTDNGGPTMTRLAAADNAWTTGAATNRAQFTFLGRVTGTPSGVVTFTVTFANTHIGCEASIFRISGTDMTSGITTAVPQAAVRVIASGTGAATCTLAAGVDADSRNVGFMAANASGTVTPDAQWDGVIANNTHATPTITWASHYNADDFQTDYSPTFSVSGAKGAMVLELANAGAVGASVNLTTVDAVAAVPALTVAADADTTTATIAALASLDTPTVTATADAAVTPTTVLALAAISTPTLAGDANLTLTTVVATASIDTPAVVATSPNADVTPSTVVGIAAIPVPEVIGNANAPPADIAAVAAVPVPSVTADAAVTPSEVVAAAAISVPVVSIEIDITVGNVSAVTTVPTPGVTTGAELNADVVFLDTPVNLAAVPFDADRIDLTWDAVTGATEYLVERDGVTVATNPDTTYSDTGLDPETTYSYRVRAVA